MLGNRLAKRNKIVGSGRITGSKENGVGGFEKVNFDKRGWRKRRRDGGEEEEEAEGDRLRIDNFRFLTQL